MEYYSGIGARDTPINICKEMENLGLELAKMEFCLRSGHAEGADQAFEKGCDLYNGMKEIYIPCKGFKNSNSELYEISKEALIIAEIFHPNWEACNSFSKKLHARNVYQVLGKTLDQHSKFIICWTKDGGPTGGTGLALRIANVAKIPIYNLYSADYEFIIKDIKDKYIK